MRQIIRYTSEAKYVLNASGDRENIVCIFHNAGHDSQSFVEFDKEEVERLIQDLGLLINKSVKLEEIDHGS